MTRVEFEALQRRFPNHHRELLAGPHLARRAFFRLAGGVAGSLILPGKFGNSLSAETRASVVTKNTAKNLIFVMMSGAPSQVDTFDLKMVPGVTPKEFAPETINGLLWPTGLFPKMAGQLSSIAILRSMRAWALVHDTAQRWMQLGRNPQGGEGRVAPHIGSIIAREKEAARSPSEAFPGFLALDVAEALGQGYFSARFAPFKYVPSIDGVPDVIHRDGISSFEARRKALAAFDAPLRSGSPAVGMAGRDLAEFYDSATKMMHNPLVDRAFRFTPGDSERYGNTAFGNACLMAKQALQERQGTRVVTIRLGGWDSHSNIYAPAPAPAGIFANARTFDNAMGALIADLKAAGLFEETLIVAGGEFGRTVGPLTAALGRDHNLQQSFLVMGGGVRGGRAIGATDPTGDYTVEAGWSRDRDIRIEDVEATIYSALGINWTTVLDGPAGPFPYIPHSEQDLYGPIHELWS